MESTLLKYYFTTNFSKLFLLSFKRYASCFFFFTKLQGQSDFVYYELFVFLSAHLSRKIVKYLSKNNHTSGGDQIFFFFKAYPIWGKFSLNLSDENFVSIV